MRLSFRIHGQISIGTRVPIQFENNPHKNPHKYPHKLPVKNLQKKTKNLQKSIAYTRFPIRSWAGFRDDGLGNSSGWLAVTVASYCPSRSSQCAEENKQNLAHERMGNLVVMSQKFSSYSTRTGSGNLSLNPARAPTSRVANSQLS